MTVSEDTRKGIGVEYRDASYRESYGRKRVKRVEARVGDICRFGATRPEAKAAVLEAVQLQAEHALVRRYLARDSIVFALSYSDGWRYDIIRDGRQGGSCCFEASSEYEAMDRMRHHFEQQFEAADNA